MRRPVTEVRLWDRTIGHAWRDPGAVCVAFQYDADFITSGIEVAPLTMPLGRRVYTFPELAGPCFKGLPGLIADSLPDRFGTTVTDAWLQARAVAPAGFDALERLRFTGTRAMGALEFAPVRGPDGRRAARLDLSRVAALSQQLFAPGGALGGVDKKALRALTRAGTSAGGSRPKAIVASQEAAAVVHSGEVPAPAGSGYWLLKFDGPECECRTPKELEGRGNIEYGYSLMAKDAGLDMSDCRLLQDGPRRHFMTRRFDRRADGDKLHMLSLAALTHTDFDASGSYEQLFAVLKRLGLAPPALEQQFARMAFNVFARNQDDHAKNVAFLMDRQGSWSLAPAFDLTFSCNPAGAWTAHHQMSVNGKRDAITADDLRACGRVAGLTPARADALMAKVRAAVGRWPYFAGLAGVPAAWRDIVQGYLRTA